MFNLTTSKLVATGLYSQALPTLRSQLLQYLGGRLHMLTIGYARELMWLGLTGLALCS